MSSPPAPTTNTTFASSTTDSPTPTIHFHLTGFGAFQGVPDNPTKQLILSLNDYWKHHPLPKNICIDGLTVLETSGVGSRESLAKLKHCCEGSDKTAIKVFLHFGVHAGSTAFKLESTAYNLADFGVPDERKWQPRNECIFKECPNEYNTLIDVESIAKRLRATPSNDTASAADPSAINGVGVNGGGWKCIVSADPGRFVCNWVYFHSLHQAQEEGAFSLFVHVSCSPGETLTKRELFDHLEIDPMIAFDESCPDRRCSFMLFWTGPFS